MTLLPLASRARARTSTSKAVSVPSRDRRSECFMRLLYPGGVGSWSDAYGSAVGRIELFDPVGQVQPLTGGAGLRRADDDAGGALPRQELDHVEARARRAKGLAQLGQGRDGPAVHALDDQVAQL